MGPGFESLRVHQWPVGQVVKTAASHAVNIGSNPVWVTKFPKIVVDKSIEIWYNPEAEVRRISEIRSKLLQYRKGNTSSVIEFVLIVKWVHLFPSRTQKLSTCTPTIVAG